MLQLDATDAGAIGGVPYLSTRWRFGARDGSDFGSFVSGEIEGAHFRQRCRRARSPATGFSRQPGAQDRHIGECFTYHNIHYAYAALFCGVAAGNVK
jgi:hypothetical protein